MPWDLLKAMFSGSKSGKALEILIPKIQSGELMLMFRTKALLEEILLHNKKAILSETEAYLVNARAAAKYSQDLEAIGFQKAHIYG